MSKKGISTPLLLGGAAVAYLLLRHSNTSPVQSVQQPVQVVDSNGNVVATVPQSTIPVTTNPAVNTSYGINSGVKGANGIYLASNYAQLLAAHPNLGNPNYQMNLDETNQYLANYLDLQQGLPSWIGKKQPNGYTPQTIQQAAGQHWYYFGCAEKRIFLPLQPPSNVAYVPPVNNPKSSGGGGGSSWIGPAIQVAGTVLAAVLGVDTEPTLNNAEIQLVLTGGAILNDILPMYLNDDPIAVKLAQNKLSDIVNQYS